MCQNCDTAFLFPMMSDEEEQAFYQSYNNHVRARGVIVSQDPGELHGKSTSVARQRLDIIRKYFIHADRVLEVGSSTGAFLELLADKVCYCVEPNDENRRFSRQFTQGGFAGIDDVPDGESFDVVCMFHVFEHIKQPEIFLNKCFRLLTTSGYLIVEVPCIADPLLSLYECNAFKDFYFQPMHPFVYSLTTLRYIFQQGGFIEEKFIFYQRYGLDNHLAWLSRGKPGGDVLLSTLFADNDEYRQVLVNNQTTDTIFYIVRKQD